MKHTKIDWTKDDVPPPKLADELYQEFKERCVKKESKNG